MFFGCTSLTIAPEILPATELAKGCYSSMFKNCTSLTTSPVLPATKLADSYTRMFEGCTKLNHITCLATDISTSNYTSYWVYGISRTGTFVKHPDMNNWTTDINGIPSGWTVVDAEL